MNDPRADLEAALHAAYLQEADCYARALQLAGDLAAACARGEAIDDRLRPILALLDEVAVHEARIAPAKQHWQQAGDRGGVSSPLRNVMDRIAALIEQLGRQLKTIEQTACERRDHLAAELDACNRRRQMQRAYAREL